MEITVNQIAAETFTLSQAERKLAGALDTLTRCGNSIGRDEQRYTAELLRSINHLKERTEAAAHELSTCRSALEKMTEEIRLRENLIASFDEGGFRKRASIQTADLTHISNILQGM